MKNNSIFILCLILISCSNPNNSLFKDQVELNSKQLQQAQVEFEERLQNLGMPVLGIELMKHFEQLNNLYNQSSSKNWAKDKDELLKIFQSTPIPSSNKNHDFLALLSSQNIDNIQHKLILGGGLLNYFKQLELEFFDLHGFYDRAEVRIDKIGSSDTEISLEVLLATSVSTLNPVIELIDGSGNSVPINVDDKSVGRITIRKTSNFSEVTFRITSLTPKGEMVREKTVQISDL